MDILNETRETQMQIPLDIVETFFGVKRGGAATLAISILTANGLSQPIDRPLVISRGKSGKRLMRRLEMPTIRGLKRPLTVLFIRTNRRGFAYRLFLRSSGEFKKTSDLLAEVGQQGSGARRYYIGDTGDAVWKQLADVKGEWYL